MKKTAKIKAISLFANIGVAEAYLDEIGVKVIAANELVPRRAKLYQKIYPNTKMICGDIFSSDIQQKLINIGNEENVNTIIATPPCQGMSTVGKQDEDDIRNTLFLPVLDIVKALKPTFVLMENVPMFLQTSVVYNGERQNIKEIIERTLGCDYRIKYNIANTADYGVPQTRERAILLMSRNDSKVIWDMPTPQEKRVTMRDAIGDLPIVDPFIRDITKEELLRMFPLYYEREKAALEISPWNRPPVHIRRQVEAMMHTPTGQSAFSNPDKYKPQKANGDICRGYFNTYKRQEWDIPAYTVTMDNRKISSQNNVHPGRYLGKDVDGSPIYSDPRALTVYELMKIMSLPDTWPIPQNTQAAFLRSIIGEGIPPLFVKKIFENLLRQL